VPANVLAVPVGVNLPDGVVVRIRHINGAGAVDRGARRAVEVRGGAVAIEIARASRRPRQQSKVSERVYRKSRRVAGGHTRTVGEHHAVALAAAGNARGRCGVTERSRTNNVTEGGAAVGRYLPLTIWCGDTPGRRSKGCRGWRRHRLRLRLRCNARRNARHSGVGAATATTANPRTLPAQWPP